jgi:hypothetical protein
MLRPLLLASALLALASTSACLDPCDQLASRICECESTTYAQEICRQRVELQKQSHDPTDADKAACEAALKTCTCDAMERLDLAQCGFARTAR